MHNYKSLYYIVLSVFLLVVSCVTVYQPSSPTAEEAPTPLPVWTVYLPNPEIPAHGTIRPVPAHQGWTNLRMERDLDRMADAKITAVLVVVTPSQLLAEDFHERYRKFAELAERHSIQIALLLTSLTRPAPALERNNIYQYLENKGFFEFSNRLCNKDGVPVVLIGEEFSLDASLPELDSMVCFLQLGHELPALPSGPMDIPAMQPSSDGVLWIRAADNFGCAPYNRARPTDDWTIPRKNGGPFQRQLEQARYLGAKLLLLDSWNDYSRGSFVENNSLDQDAFLKILKNR